MQGSEALAQKIYKRNNNLFQNKNIHTMAKVSNTYFILCQENHVSYFVCFAMDFQSLGSVRPCDRPAVRPNELRSKTIDLDPFFVESKIDPKNGHFKGQLGQKRWRFWGSLITAPRPQRGLSSGAHSSYFLHRRGIFINCSD